MLSSSFSPSQSSFDPGDFRFFFKASPNSESSSFTLFSARGLEWREASRKNAVVPTLRLERVHWAWGGLDGEDVGLFILKLDGVSFRVSRKDGSTVKEDAISERQVTSLLLRKLIQQPSRPTSSYTNKVTSSVLRLFIHHYPSIARVVSLQVSDVRVVFDDLDGLEVTIRDFRLGVKVNFEGDVDASPTSKPSSPMSPGAEFTRGHPFSPGIDSPDLSGNYFSSFSLPATPTPSPTKSRTKVTGSERLADARRKATVIQTRMTSSASQIWSRATARARGSVFFTSSFQDIAIILPHAHCLPPMSARPSVPDLRFQTRMQAESLDKATATTRPVYGSTQRRQSLSSLYSLNSLISFRNSEVRFALSRRGI